MVASCIECGVVIDGGDGPGIVTASPEEAEMLNQANWWRLAEFVLFHQMQHHPKKAEYVVNAGNSISRIIAMQGMSSTDANVTALLEKNMALVCDRFATAKA